MRSDLERRLRSAAAEAQRVAARTDLDERLRDITGRRRRPMPAVAVLAAVALAAVVAAVVAQPRLPVPEIAPGASPGPTVTPEPSPTVGPGPTRPSAPEDCSAAGLPGQPAPQSELPPEVASLRDRIAEAAVACDYDALGALIDPSEFSYSFGDDGDPIGNWQRGEADDQKPEPMVSLRRVLDTPPGTWQMVSAGPSTLWVWPRLAQMDPQQTSASELESAIDEVVDAGLHPRDMVEQMVYEYGGYLGYRLQIEVPEHDPTNPRWVVFIAGD